jgi:hypothetical protein
LLFRRIFCRPWHADDGANLDAAHKQLLQYREAMENPPLLVVCHLNRFEIHTNFSNTVQQIFAFNVDELAAPDNLAVLRALFTEPDWRRPTVTRIDTPGQQPYAPRGPPSRGSL